MRAGLLALLLCTGGCQINLGATSDAGACQPAPDYFVSDVWSGYLQSNQCTNLGCHDFSDGHGYLRLRSPEPEVPSPGMPLSAWPAAWKQNYLSAIQLVRCDQPLASRLLTVPEGIGNLHPPGPVVTDRALAAQVIETWVAR
jgi:hypothetical protein